ncbi:MAG: UDP-N-acetylmuramate dehydrogenase [Halioglobus sp.]
MNIQTDVSLQSLHTLRLKSQARALCTVSGSAELREALAWARAEGLPPAVLGEGSNVVLPEYWEALVILQRTNGIDVLAQDENSVCLRVGAGENWHAFIAWALGQGYFGLENLALIPGTVGAAPIQNIGAYGVEVAPFIESVHGIVTADAAPVTLSTTDCQFAYRNSVFKGALRDEVIITAVDLHLSKQPGAQTAYPSLQAHLQSAGIDHATPLQVFNAVMDIRRSKLPDPAEQPNAGSFFKNPVLDMAAANALRERFPGVPCYAQSDGSVKVAAAWLIDQCGWRGHRVRGVGVHSEHALVLVNDGGDSAQELLQLASTIAADVAAKFDIDLAIEPRVYP